MSYLSFTLPGYAIFSLSLSGICSVLQAAVCQHLTEVWSGPLLLLGGKVLGNRSEEIRNKGIRKSSTVGDKQRQHNFREART